jgi:uncharacterized protein with HEPN domain
MLTEEDRERERLRYILESIVRIEQYTAGGEEAFLTQPIIQDAVLRRLETLADATSKLSDALKGRHPEIPWRQVYGFRNIAAHGYLELHLDRVWEIIESHLSSLKAVVAEELGCSDQC